MHIMYACKISVILNFIRHVELLVISRENTVPEMPQLWVSKISKLFQHPGMDAMAEIV